MSKSMVTREAHVHWASAWHRSRGLDALRTLPFVQEASGDMNPDRIRITLKLESFDPDGLEALIRTHGGEMRSGWRDWASGIWEHVHHRDD